jgi:hypothetical protein
LNAEEDAATENLLLSAIERRVAERNKINHARMELGNAVPPSEVHDRAATVSLLLKEDPLISPASSRSLYIIIQIYIVPSSLSRKGIEIKPFHATHASFNIGPLQAENRGLFPSHSIIYLGGLSHSHFPEHIDAVSICRKLEASCIGWEVCRGLTHSNFPENIGLSPLDGSWRPPA